MTRFINNHEGLSDYWQSNGLPSLLVIVRGYRIMNIRWIAKFISNYKGLLDYGQLNGLLDLLVTKKNHQIIDIHEGIAGRLSITMNC